MGLSYTHGTVTDPAEEFILTHGIDLTDCPRCRRTLIAGERCPNGCAQRHAPSHGALRPPDAALESEPEAFGWLAERALAGRLRGFALA